jgi:hypothetical protein
MYESREHELKRRPRWRSYHASQPWFGAVLSAWTPSMYLRERGKERWRDETRNEDERVLHFLKPKTKGTNKHTSTFKHS